MFTTTKIALSVAIVLGAASAALANDQSDERGGFVIAGSTDGVNPVYHKDIFGNAGSAFGYAPSPKQTHPAKQRTNAR
jgi:hypothetical protein